VRLVSWECWDHERGVKFEGKRIWGGGSPSYNGKTTVSSIEGRYWKATEVGKG